MEFFPQPAAGWIKPVLYR